MQYEVKMREAVRIWPDHVDQYVRRHTQAVMVKDRVLYVHTDSSTLTSELTLREKNLRERLNRALKTPIIGRIVFKTGRVAPLEDGKNPEKPPASALTMKTIKEIDTTVRGVHDEELRETLRRFLKTAASHRR
jgi:hypothetical protein